MSTAWSGGNRHAVEDHLVAVAGAQAQVVPALDDALARVVAGRIARHEEGADARLGLVGARPDAEPAQPRMPVV
jgi:hypothetical protein